MKVHMIIVEANEEKKLTLAVVPFVEECGRVPLDDGQRREKVIGPCSWDGLMEAARQRVRR